MSFTALNWAWEQNCRSGTAKSVLVFLANCASQEGGDCYPSVTTICQRTQHHAAAVRRALRELVEDKMLEVTHRRMPNQRQTSNLYRLPVVTLPDAPKHTPEPTPAISHPSPDLAAAPTPAISHPSPDLAPPKSPPSPLRFRTPPPCDFATPILEPSLELPKEPRKKEKTPPTPSTPPAEPFAKPKRKAKPPALAIFAQLGEVEQTHKRELTECDQVVDAWNAMARATGLPQARTNLTADRRAHLRARIGDYGLETLISAVDQIRDCPFLLGDNDRGWRADFAWMLQRDAANKILEGRYAARAKKPQGVFAKIAEQIATGTFLPDVPDDPPELVQLEDTYGN